MYSFFSTDHTKCLVEDPLDCMLDRLIEHEGKCRHSSQAEL